MVAVAVYFACGRTSRVRRRGRTTAVRYPPMMLRLSLVLAALLIVGCDRSGPATTRTVSSKFPTVAARSKFLHQYVTFRRTYETLDFDIMYQTNGGGLVPGPSEWDVRLVATVPASELPAWVPAGASAVPAPDASWLKSVPTTLDLSGVNEWYDEGHRVVGLDRARRLVVHRAWSS